MVWSALKTKATNSDDLHTLRHCSDTAPVDALSPLSLSLALFFSDNPPTPRYDIARHTPAVQLATHGVQGDVCRAHQRRTSTEPRGATKPFLLLPTEARGHAPLAGPLPPLQPGIFVDHTQNR